MTLRNRTVRLADRTAEMTITSPSVETSSEVVARIPRPAVPNRSRYLACDGGAKSGLGGLA